MKRKQDENDLIMVLSIRREHASRIFQGTKKYELRKRLPGHRVKRVFLYESGGGGIIGCFDVAEMIALPVEQLWQRVGEEATSEDRFKRYFAGRLFGFAIKISNPVKFQRPINFASLRKQLPKFSAPMSFLVLKPGVHLGKLLEKKRREETKSRSVQLFPISPKNHRLYIKLVTEVISAKYDEITPKFAKAAIRSHKLGRDPNGIFTTGKAVLEVRDEKKSLVGFTTLTSKIGGSVKTGPTIMLKKFRGRGFGSATRRAIEERVLGSGGRKLYCTCPDNDTPVLSYLLSAGYRIEAHLKSHYRVGNGELVLGKLLAQPRSASALVTRAKTATSKLAKANEFKIKELIRDATNLLRQASFDVNEDITGSMLDVARSKPGSTYEDKPLDVVYLKSRGRLSGVAIMIPKRGGSMKLLIAVSSSNEESVRALIRAAETRAKDSARRKVYVLQPTTDPWLTRVLVTSGFFYEGILQEPYAPGVDCAVLSKLI